MPGFSFITFCNLLPFAVWYFYLDRKHRSMWFDIALTITALLIFSSLDQLYLFKALLFCYNFAYLSGRNHHSIEKGLLIASVIYLVSHATPIATEFLFPMIVEKGQIITVVQLIKLVIIETCCGILILTALKWIYHKVKLIRAYMFLFTILFVLLSLFFEFQFILYYYIQDNAQKLIVNSFLVFTIFLVMLVSIIYQRSLKKQADAEKILSEHRLQMQYLKDMEKQHIEMKKFKHDYQNILLSMTGYFENQRYEELEQYFREKILPTSLQFQEEQFALADLGRIQVEEVKSLLMVKLTIAQKNGSQVKLSVPQEIQHFPLDTISLIRILGILLDNCIEELETINDGVLEVAILKNLQDTTILIRNSCKEKEVSLASLMTEGASTKGTGRGQGLATVFELLGKQENVFCETDMRNGYFTQKIMMVDNEERS